MAKKILVVDDDQAMARLIDQVLSQEGYEVYKAQDGEEGLKQTYAHRPDLVILDIMMPKMDGWTTCWHIRQFSDVPIVILTVKEREDDVVRGLDYGADEYLVKPISPKELSARVRAILRRAELPPPRAKTVGFTDDYLNIDFDQRSVRVNGDAVRLTATEFRLLAHLVENAGRVVSHKELLERVWGAEYVDDIDFLRIYIWHLRQKLEPESSKPKYILTEARVGYRFLKTK